MSRKSSEHLSFREATLMAKAYKSLNFYMLELLSKWRGLVWPLVQPQFKRPIFVVGCSRSGTTVVYKVLSMAREIASMNKESHEFWFNLHPPAERNWDSHILTSQDIGVRDLEEVSKFYFCYLGARRFVDKFNQNCFTIPYLQSLFPDAFFVYVKRDGRDNINSLIHGWARPDEYAIWSKDIPLDIEIENGQYRRWCFFLFPGWRSFVKSSIEEVCAQQWLTANQMVLDSKKIVHRNQWVELFYEDILRSAADVFKEVYKKLDLTFNDTVKHHCETLVANPYNAFSQPKLEKWREENTSRIIRIFPLIKPTMLQMGYEV